jgi:hypothetical protein
MRNRHLVAIAGAIVGATLWAATVSCGKDNGTRDASATDGASCCDGPPSIDSGGGGGIDSGGGGSGGGGLGDFCSTTAGDAGFGTCKPGLMCCTGTTVCREPEDCSTGTGYVACTDGSNCSGGRVCCQLGADKFCTKVMSCTGYGGTVIP